MKWNSKHSNNNSSRRVSNKVSSNNNSSRTGVRIFRVQMMAMVWMKTLQGRSAVAQTKGCGGRVARLLPHRNRSGAQLSRIRRP